MGEARFGVDTGYSNPTSEPGAAGAVNTALRWSPMSGVKCVLPSQACPMHSNRATVLATGRAAKVAV